MSEVWPDAQIIFHHFAMNLQWKFAQYRKIRPNWVKNFFDYKKDVGKITKTFIKCKSGKISPNLVTLSMTAPCVCALKELNEFLELLELDSFCAMNRVEKK